MRIPKISVYEIGFLVVLCTICSIVSVIIFGIIFQRVTTTGANSQLRDKIVDLIFAMWSTVSVILGYKLRDYFANKDEEKKQTP